MLVDACARFVQAARDQAVADADRVIGLAGSDAEAAVSVKVSADLIDARNALYELLIAEGWAPPKDILDRLSLDEALAREDVGLRQG